jgi:multiple sugar transport system substrate-binding protein
MKEDEMRVRAHVPLWHSATGSSGPAEPEQARRDAGLSLRDVKVTGPAWPAGPRHGPAPTRRRLLLGAGAAGAVPFFSACAPGGAPPSPQKGVRGKVTVLSYQTSSPRWDMQVQLYEEFNAKHKGLQVEFINPGQSVMEKAIALHVAGTPADMWEWPRLWREIETIIADLSPFFKRDKIDQGMWIPAAIESMKQGDRIWGMPVSISADAMAVNLDLFTEQFGFGGGFTGGSAWMNGPTYFGYGPVDWAAKKVTINTPGFQQGLQFWADMATKYHVQPYGDEANRLRSVPGQHIFTTGKIGMAVIFNLAERPSFRWMIAALPYTPNPQQPRNVSARISVHALFIDSDSKNKDQAWEVFKYWMKPENVARYVLSDGHVVTPLLKGAFELTAKDFQDRMGADPRAYFLQGQRSKVDGWLYYLLKDFAKARAEIDPLWTRVTAGEMSVGDFTSQAQAITERLTSF